ncbi:MAG: ABC transporter permease [Anaerolineae bacterium]|nr:ABC transporter permease [Anaerolineae bacterium]
MTVSFALRLIVLGALVIGLMAASNVSLGAIGQGLALALVGVGVYISFRLLAFPDLTVDGSFAIGGAVAAALITQGVEPGMSLLAAFAAGAITGLCTALIHVLLRIEGLLASIIVVTGAYTFTLRIMGKSNIPLLDAQTILTPYIAPVREFLVSTFGNTARRLTVNVVEILIFAVIVIIVLLILNWFMHTEIGLALRASGKNRQMVRAIGVDDRAMTVLALMLANGLVGLAGALSVQQQGFADVQMGVGIIVRGLASVMIGEVLLRPRTIRQSVLAVTIGMIIFEVLRAWVFTALSLTASDVRLASAMVVLVALAGPTLSGRWRDWQRRRQLKAMDNAATQ